MSSKEEQRRNAMAAVSRAEQAKVFLDNPFYTEAITVMNAKMYMKFEGTTWDNEAERHELWQRMQLMKEFKAEFESIVRHGEKGEQTLTFLEKTLKVLR